jgi:hypothetical protein
VGPGGIEPPTSPLSGVRSSHLSYRPGPCLLPLPNTWWSWSGSNRRPPECKSGALPAELQPLKKAAIFSRPRPLWNLIEASWMQRPEGQLPIASEKLHMLQVEIRIELTTQAEARIAVWSGTAVPYSLPRVHSTGSWFRKLHPRSLLERR